MAKLSGPHPTWPRTGARTHTFEKPYACDHPGCAASFAQIGSLGRHKSTHALEKPYACNHPGCAASFVQFGSLAIDERTHPGEGARLILQLI